MSYIHKTSFDIIQGTNIDDELENYFEVDEPIALTIQVLNRKGYITEFCCCGHAFGDSGEAFADPETPNCEHIIVGTYATEKLPDGSHRILFHNRPEHSAYIAFAKDSALPPAPANWYYHENSLQCDYPGDIDEFAFWETMLRSMRALYIWACHLPVAGTEQPANSENADLIFAIQSYLQSRGLQYESSIDAAINARLKGKSYCLSEHIKGLVYSLLTNQTSWKRIVPHLREIDDVFFQYDIDKIKATSPAYFSDALFAIKCGNRKTAAQMAALTYNIEIFERISNIYGSMDDFVTSAPAHEIVALLASSGSEYKLRQVGEALAWEYIRNVGIDGAKPDLHLRRFFGKSRIGKSNRDPATVQEVIAEVESLAKSTGLSMATIDNLIWSYCADGYGEICTATPHCTECAIRALCNRDR